MVKNTFIMIITVVCLVSGKSAHAMKSNVEKIIVSLQDLKPFAGKVVAYTEFDSIRNRPLPDSYFNYGYIGDCAIDCQNGEQSYPLIQLKKDVYRFKGPVGIVLTNVILEHNYPLMRNVNRKEAKIILKMLNHELAGFDTCSFAAFDQLQSVTKKIDK